MDWGGQGMRRKKAGSSKEGSETQEKENWRNLLVGVCKTEAAEGEQVSGGAALY